MRKHFYYLTFLLLSPLFDHAIRVIAIKLDENGAGCGAVLLAR